MVNVLVPHVVAQCARRALAETWAGGGAGPISPEAAMMASVLRGGVVDLATLQTLYTYWQRPRPDDLESRCHGGRRAPGWLAELQRAHPVRNPECTVHVRKGGLVTDRAQRYRANQCPPPGERRCAFCGVKRSTSARKRPSVEVGHVNGYEEDTRPANLIWTCRRCNVQCARTLGKAGIGRRTRQYNPSGAKSVGQWVVATMSMRGLSSEMSVADAVAMIEATPAEDRSAFAREIWRRRRERGTDKWQSEIPF